RDVADVFIAAHPHVTNDILQRARHVRLSSDRLMYFPGDDKGYGDFAMVALRVFGLRVESMYYCWFVFFGISIAAFTVVFWRDTDRMVVLCVVTSAVYAAFFVLPLSFELGPIQNPRAFGAVSAVAVLHLSLSMLDRHRPSPLNVSAGLAQAALIALAVHVRTTEWWQVLAV